MTTREKAGLFLMLVSMQFFLENGWIGIVGTLILLFGWSLFQTENPIIHHYSRRIRELERQVKELSENSLSKD